MAETRRDAVSLSGQRADAANGCRRRHRSWLRLPRICLVMLFKGYQFFISPFFPPACRFVPSCSQYAIEAVEKYGAVRGVLLAVWRILRCHPLSRGGYDPVK